QGAVAVEVARRVVGAVALEQQHRTVDDALGQLAVGGAVDVHRGVEARVGGGGGDGARAGEGRADGGAVLGGQAGGQSFQPYAPVEPIEDEAQVGGAGALVLGEQCGQLGLAVGQPWFGGDHPVIGQRGDRGLVGVVDGEDHEAARGQVGDQGGVEGARGAVAGGEQ